MKTHAPPTPTVTKYLRVLGCCLLAAASPCAARDGADRALLFPKLSLGQTFRYQIGYRAATNTDTQSTVAAPMAPTGGQTNANLLLQIAVDDVRIDGGRPVAHLRVQIIDADAAAVDSAKPSSSAPGSNAVSPLAHHERQMAFTLHADGQATDIEGLDKLSGDEQAAWQEWLARFSGGASFPEKGIRPGEKWKTEEPIAHALLTGLSWEKESEYVNDAPCSATKITPQGDLSPQTQVQEKCAVILTTAIMKQKSPQKDSTPEDYKLHDLRTLGVAKGKNETITYISLKTGFVVRASDDANQSMNVIIAKSDGSNRVHYTIDAESHAQVLLLASGDATAAHP